MNAPRFRVATPDERDYYEKVLYPLQNRILAVAARYGEALVLTGGTALARLHLHHRYSDDLDFFTLQGYAGALGRDFANELRSNGFVVEPATEAVAFMQMWVGDGEHRVQVGIAPDAQRVESPLPSTFGVYAHTLRDIGANKIGGFEDRSEVKYAVDLYHVARHLTWRQLFDDAQQKRMPVAYEDLRHFLEAPLAGSALLLQPIDDAGFARFFAASCESISTEVKQKSTAFRLRLDSIVSDLLWDTPRELRTINEQTRGVLERRVPQLPLPQRIVLLEALAAA